MNKYINIDGTSKPSFSIGSKTITIVPTAIKSGEETIMKIAIKEKGKENSRFLLFEDEVKIPSSYCETIIQNDNETIFKIREPDGTIKEIILKNSTGNGDIKGPNISVKGNLAMFNSTDGSLLADSGVAVKDKILFDEEGNVSQTEIPTIKAVVDYIGDINDILKLRLNGKI